jgi:uncharacterized OsmC-like protein
VAVDRIPLGVFTATNSRSGQFRFGTGSDTGLTPTELLLAAIAGGTVIDADLLISQRAEPDSFQVRADTDKIRDTGATPLTGIQATFPDRVSRRRGRRPGPDHLAGYGQEVA